MAELLTEIAHNAGALALLALAFFWLSMRVPFGNEPCRRSVHLGVLMGVSGFLVSRMPTTGQELMIVRGDAGPLLFAGFLGGPIAAAIAAALTGLARTLHDGSIVYAGVAESTAYAIVGTAFGWHLRRRAQAVQVTLAATLSLIGLSLGVLFVVDMLFDPDGPGGSWHNNSVVFAALSNVYTAGIIAYALRAVFKALDTAKTMRQMRERLGLATSAAQIRVWEYDFANDLVHWANGNVPATDPGGAQAPQRWNDWLLGIHPDDRERVRAAACAALAGKADFETEFRMITEDDRTGRPLRAKAVVLRDEAGQAERLLGVNFDVSELRRYETELRARQMQLETLAQAMPGVILTIVWRSDGDVSLRYISAGSTELWELSPEEIGTDIKHLTAMIDPAHHDRISESVKRAQATEAPWFGEWPITTPSGQKKWLQCHTRCRRIDPDTLEYHALVLDITEQISVKMALEESTHMLAESRKLEAVGKLTAGIAHDFNNLLAVIMGNLELLDQRPDGEEQEMIGDALRACQRGAKLTQQLLAFGRKAMLVPEELDLNDVMTSTEQLLRRTLRTTIRIEVTRGDNLAHVKLDPWSLANALLNLALNSSDAMPPGGRLMLETANVVLGPDQIYKSGADAVPGEYVMIAVSDDGVGMDPAIGAKAYEPFFTTKPVGSGSGMGLSMVHGFVKQSAGVIDMTSAPGQGTTIRMFFPAAPDRAGQTEEALAPATPKPADTKELHVLLVEDDRDVRRAVSRQITRLGHRLTQAEDGLGGLKALKTDPSIDLLVTDVIMPGPMQGPQLAEQLHAMRPEVPVVFLSGYLDLLTQAQTLLRERDRQIMKPVQYDQLAAVLHDVLN